MSLYYKLDKAKKALPCNAREWGLQREEMRDNGTKIIALGTIHGKRISTVWIGINSESDFTLPPLIFETMIFGDKGETEDYCEQYSTWDEALAGHQRAIEWVKTGCKDD